MILYVGIDISKDDMKVYFMENKGSKLHFEAYANDNIGATRLRDTALKLAMTHQIQEIIFGVEATSVYHKPLVHFLKNDDYLSVYDIGVYTLNARQVANFKKALSEMEKNDYNDSMNISEFVRFGRYTKNIDRDPIYDALLQLTRKRHDISQSLSSEKNKFQVALFLKCNTLSKEVDTSIFGAGMQDFIQDFPDLDVIKDMEIEELTVYLRIHSKNGFTDARKVAESIKAAIKNSYRLDKVTDDAISITLATSMNLIRFYKSQIKTLDKAIADMIKKVPNSIMTIPGIGPTFAAGIIAEMGQVTRFKSEKSLAKYAGLFWKRNQSGDFRSENSKLAHTGNRYLRYYLIEAADSVRKYEKQYAEYYKRKYKEVKTHQHKRAIALTARKLCRLIFVLLVENKNYTTNKL